MKKKMRRILLGLASTVAVVAPVAAAISCGETTSSDSGSASSNPENKIFDDSSTDKMKDLENLLPKDDAATVSTNLISQAKYELSFALYDKEQVASLAYQKEFSRWDIYVAQKNLLGNAKEIAALVKSAQLGRTVTADQITVALTAPTPYDFPINEVLGLTYTNGQYSAEELFNKVYSFATPSTMTDTSFVKKSDFETKISSFKTSFDAITTLTTKMNDIAKLAADQGTNLGTGSSDDSIKSASAWSSTTLSSDYPKVLKPRAVITLLQRKALNEAKATLIAQYPQNNDAAHKAWADQLKSGYNNAANDEEAIKYKVNQEIQTAAFGQFSYSLNSSYTMEQALATYVDKDDANKVKHVFSYFDSFSDEILGDKTWSESASAANTPVESDPNYKYTIFTNTKAEFTDPATTSKLLNINISNVTDLYGDESTTNKITPLLSNKLYFLSKKSLLPENVIVDLHSSEQKAIFDKSSPIKWTHSLIAAKQATSFNLPWTIAKTSVIKLLSYWGTGAQQGIDLFAQLYTGNSSTQEEDLFNQNISDDTGSVANNGELGTQSYQWYSRSGGMNDGFALATMAAYTYFKNVQTPSTTDDINMGKVNIDSTNNLAFTPSSSTNAPQLEKPSGSASDTQLDGQDILAYLKDAFNYALPKTVKDQVAAAKAANNIGLANKYIENWVNSLTDDNVNATFGSIFQNAFQNRDVVYEVGNSTSNDHKTYLLASPDSGVHVINLTAGISSWIAAYVKDMQAVANQNDASKAKITWSDIYSGIFDDNKIVQTLLDSSNPTYGTTYQEVLKTALMANVNVEGEDPEPLWQTWSDAKYIDTSKLADADKTNKDVIGKLVIDAINKSITASEINTDYSTWTNAVKGRIETYLVGQQDNKFMNDQIDPVQLYNGLLESLKEYGK